MTVRAWFRGMRQPVWDDGFTADLDRLTLKVIRGEPIDRVESLGRWKLILRVAEWERRTRLLELLHQDLLRAMAELERESARRVVLDRIARDILA